MRARLLIPLLTALLTALPAQAGGLRLQLENSGTQRQLVVEMSQPGQRLVLEANGQAQLQREHPGAREVLELPTGLSGRIQVRLLDAESQELARASLSLPAATPELRLHVLQRQVAGAHLRLPVSAGPGLLNVYLNGQIVQTRTLKTAGLHVLAPMALSPGKHRLQAELIQPERTLKTPVFEIFYFGVEPLDHSWLLADKYNFTLYWIRAGVLHQSFPVATGRPSLPTPTGFFLVGGKDVMYPQSDWGSFRMRIYREDKYPHHWSGYAVHGTNRPTSIGTEASHGCLRMFNQDVTALYPQVALGTPLLIVEKLPVVLDSEVDIDKTAAPAGKKEHQ
jgi:hypothetical protein